MRAESHRAVLCTRVGSLIRDPAGRASKAVQSSAPLAVGRGRFLGSCTKGKGGGESRNETKRDPGWINPFFSLFAKCKAWGMGCYCISRSLCSTITGSAGGAWSMVLLAQMGLTEEEGIEDVREMGWG